MGNLLEPLRIPDEAIVQYADQQVEENSDAEKSEQDGSRGEASIGHGAGRWSFPFKVVITPIEIPEEGGCLGFVSSVMIRAYLGYQRIDTCEKNHCRTLAFHLVDNAFIAIPVYQGEASLAKDRSARIFPEGDFVSVVAQQGYGDVLPDLYPLGYGREGFTHVELEGVILFLE